MHRQQAFFSPEVNMNLQLVMNACKVVLAPLLEIPAILPKMPYRVSASTQVSAPIR